MKQKIMFIFLGLYATLLTAYEYISPGVQYEHFTTNNPQQSIHVLIADPQEIIINIGVANNICASAEKTTAMAQRTNAIAAINGGFFDFAAKNKIQDNLIKFFDCLGFSKYKVFPTHTLQKSNNYYSLSHVFTGAVGWNDNDQRPSYGIIKTDIALIVNGQTLPVNELNKPHPCKPTLYSDCYDKTSPLFSQSQKITEVIIEDSCIKTIQLNSRGKTKIPHNGWIYTIPKEYKHLADSLQEGDMVSIVTTHEQQSEPTPLRTKEAWISKEHILASVPLLILEGEVVPYLKDLTSTFYTKRHPRSAVGVLNDGKWVFLVIDGRQRHSKGFTLLELAQFMKDLGCIGALNLDGGGSSTMVIRDKIVNKPSGREYSLSRKERPISNALLICPR